MKPSLCDGRFLVRKSLPNSTCRDVRGRRLGRLLQRSFDLERPYPSIHQQRFNPNPAFAPQLPRLQHGAKSETSFARGGDRRKFPANVRAVVAQFSDAH